MSAKHRPGEIAMSIHDINIFMTNAGNHIYRLLDDIRFTRLYYESVKVDEEINLNIETENPSIKKKGDKPNGKNKK
jgi:hypothetical protein